MIGLYIIFCAGVLVSAFPKLEKPYYDLEIAEQHFEEFVQKFNKQYVDETEKQMRFEIFKSNLVDINEINAKFNQTVFGINQFTDITQDEFKMYLGTRPMTEEDGMPCNEQFDSDITTQDAPDSFDWRDRNVVTAPKNQGGCGSCWAFSAIANIESQYAIKHGEQKEFSEQELVDCDDTSEGCNGGLTTKAFSKLVNLGGVESESDYAYTGVDGQCAFDKTKVQATLTGCTHYTLMDEDKVKELLYTAGPLCIALEATFFKKYTGGILPAELCPPGEPINHAVLLVGYGNDNASPYWIIKNSYGAEWGEQGYIRIARGVNMCSFLNEGLSTSVVA